MSNDDPAQIILASQSPRRGELLSQIGIHFIIRPVDVDEQPLAGEQAGNYAIRVAAAKSLAARERYGQQCNLPVLAADTTVVIDNEILGKPATKEDANRVLTKLSGECHQVISAVSLRGAEHWQTTSLSSVWLRRLEKEEIDAYWHMGEPQDKAGAYAIQGKAAIFISRIEGSYSGVMGLPLFETAQLFKVAGIPLWNGASRA